MKRIVWATLILCLLLSVPALSEGLLPQGLYTAEVSFSGGTGRAHVGSPAQLCLQDGLLTATVVWSSPFYEWMRIGEETYYPVNTEGNSTFEIPVRLDEDIKVSAQTVAMSQPHVIDYVLRFDAASLKPVPQERPDALGNGWVPVRSLALEYAAQFSVDIFEGGYQLIQTSDGSRFLTVPEGKQAPEGIAPAIRILHQPLGKIYLAATSAMCLFDEMDTLEAIRFSGTRAEDWYSERARLWMAEKRILFAGKYSEPDYELLLSGRCDLAIESTMISHAPHVKEKLEELGIPVLVDLSSQEKHPLGRTEWMKLYAALTGREEKAEELFHQQVEFLKQAAAAQSTGKTVAFFYISSSGYAVARKSGDYVSRMIGLAGGEYIFSDLGDPEKSTSTVTLEMEKFYATAKEADIIIYNSTIGGELKSLQELIEKNELLKDFKAVRNGNVWCTDKNLFQQTTQLGRMVLDFNLVFANEDPGLTRLEFLYKLQ